MPISDYVRELRRLVGTRLLLLPGVFGGRGFRHRYPNGDQAEFTVVVFECEVIGGALAPLDGEALEFRFMPHNEINALELPYPRELFDSTSTSAMFNS